MICDLRIRNLALLEQADLELEEGFMALTGETGAGKSVLLGALALLAGARGDKGRIRKGADVCQVEASIWLRDTAEIDERLEALGLPTCEDATLLLSRSIHRSRAPKATVNGQLTTVANLQDIGTLWIDFHGPGEPQKLFHESWQLQFLDLFAKTGSALSAYRETYREWRRLLDDIARLRGEEQLSEDQIEHLQAQVALMDSIDISDEAIDDLEKTFKRIQSAQDLQRLASEIEETLRGDDGVNERLSALVTTARELAALDPDTGPLCDRLEALVIEADDVASEIAAAGSAFAFDDEQAHEITQRMETWLEIRRKFGPDVSAVLAKRSEFDQRIAVQGDIEGTIIKREQEAEAAKQKLIALGDKLGDLRRKGANDLGKQVQPLIDSLGFKKAELKLDVFREPEPKAHGTTSCRFLFRSNPGQDLLPLSKIASSGEIARVMLALKAILARVDSTPVLVFDEVDANVGGEIAKAVAAELKALGENRQVICVTHLPQVAACAHQHFVVEKEQGDDATLVTISRIDTNRKERLDELSRMLGDRASKTAREHATELLSESLK